MHLRRTGENVSEIGAFAALTGGAAGLEAVLADLNRVGKRSRGWFGRAVREAYTWDAADRRTRDWYPQGITTTTHASRPATQAGVSTDLDDVLAITWYAKERNGLAQGSRVTFYDRATARYRHVLLVVPVLRESEDGEQQLKLEPLRVHAGGIVWAGPFLHIAATARGFMTCRVDDILRIPDEVGDPAGRRLGIADDRVSSYGYRYVLPVRFAYRAESDSGVPRLRYSCLSLDTSSLPPVLITGEFGRGDQTTRIARFPLDPVSLLPLLGNDGRAMPTDIDDSAVRRLQGVARVQGTHYASVSHGPLLPGSVYAGAPGSFRGHHFAMPMGPEDLSPDVGGDRLWSLSEYPGRRWIYSMDRAFFD